MSWEPWNKVTTKARPAPPDRRPIRTRIRELLDQGVDHFEVIEQLGADVCTPGLVAEVDALGQLDRRNELPNVLPPTRR